MQQPIPKIYPITDVRTAGLSHSEQAKRLIHGGARILELREKYAAPADWIDDARAAIEMAHARGVTVIVNDRVDIALVLEADGVHLGQDDLDPAAARRLMGPERIIGYSTHTLDQVWAADGLPIDYLAFGPVFPTSTKADPAAVTGLPALAEAVAIAGAVPIVAIGGITKANARQAFEHGAASVAVISAALSDPQRIGENLGELISIGEQYS